MVEGTKAELRPEEQSETVESCLENLWNEIQLKGPQTEIDQNKKKRSGQAQLVYMSLT